MSNIDKQILDFLGQVYVNFKRSEIAYNNYLRDNKKFLHAKVLRFCNETIRKLLLENCYMLPDNLCSDSLELISHYDIWIEKWYELEKLKKPDLDEEFIFLNNFTFPKVAAQNLENEFMKIIKV